MRKILILSIMVLISVSFFNCEEDVESPYDTSGQLPAVTIIRPADNDSFTWGDTILFEGEGENYEGIDLDDSMMVWRSDRDDTIGTGTVFERGDLSVNVHNITLTGTDRRGRINSDDIIIEVAAWPEPEEYELITVSASSGYQMGWSGIDAGEEPVHTVSLSGFLVGKNEVPYSLWADIKAWAELNGYSFGNEGSRGYGSGPTDQDPVTDISWTDCVAWCNAYSERLGLTPVYYTDSGKASLYKDSSEDADIDNNCVNWSADGFRLLTEAEWEYSARYINGTDISSGAHHSGYDLHTAVDDCAWYINNSGSSTHPVGQLLPNSLGAKDMSGNVWEWCWDWYGSYTDLFQDNPRGPESGYNRVIRGGCCLSTAEYCRTAVRDLHDPDYPDACLGFRVCRGNI